MKSHFNFYVIILALQCVAGCCTLDGVKYDEDDDYRIYSDYVCTY